MEKNLNLIVEPKGENDNFQIVRFNGEFDKAGQSEVKEALDDAVKSFDGSTLVFDFNALKFINSEGIGYLMEIHTHLMNRDKRLVIVGLNAHVKDVFQTIGIGEIIPVYESLDDFLAS